MEDSLVAYYGKMLFPITVGYGAGWLNRLYRDYPSLHGHTEENLSESSVHSAFEDLLEHPKAGQDLQPVDKTGQDILNHPMDRNSGEILTLLLDMLPLNRVFQKMWEPPRCGCRP
jgi:hypothetical protein